MTTNELSRWVRDEARAWGNEAQDALRHTTYVGLRQVQCRQTNGRLVLSGSVPNFHLKQVAQSVVLNHFGSAIAVDNRLKVKCVITTDLETIGEEALPSDLYD